MNLELEIKESLRFLLLPIQQEKEDECLAIIKNLLNEQGVPESAYAEFIRLNYEEWKADGHLSSTLKAIISESLKNVHPTHGMLFSEKYFSIQSSLVKNPFVSFDLSIILLSHLRLIFSLSVDEKMASAKIVKVLKAIDHRLNVLSWKDIQSVLNLLKVQPQLRQSDVTALYTEDIKLEEEYFADADITDASFLVGEVANRLHFSDDASKLLNTLTDPGKTHYPYLQILHYQCLITGFYDHSLTTAYEFSPRGDVANWLFSKWDSLLHTGNPILNNAKAVDVLDENWARSRKPNEYEAACVLVSLLKGLDGMGFAAAQELTSWIRRWLIRFIRLKSVDIIPITSTLSTEQIVSILEYIMKKPTETYGILEQRVVDVISSTLYPKGNGWRSRGLGDSVNSSNIAKKKLGDCDFQHSENHTIVAFEAHGGVLSKVYFDGHVRTFRRSLKLRIEEMEMIADLNEWKITVIFVAYGFESGLPTIFSAEGIEISVEFITFEELVARLQEKDEPFVTEFNKLFVENLNNRRTPSAVRDKIHSLLAS